MSYESFWVLHAKLHEGILQALLIRSDIISKRRTTLQQQQNLPHQPRSATGNFKAPPIPNGPVPTSIRLACAIRYFTGASPYDLMVLYGLSYASVMHSVWLVVDSINSVEEFHISYPEDHQQQRRIAAEFREVSEVGFDNCAGAVDGVLIWIHKPSQADADRSGIGLKKMYCGRKNKFGLNCQAVADRRGRFLDISICYGGSSADCLAFEASDLGKRLETGLLQPGLTLFGDNAYLNSPYMATPYQNVSGGSKDNYNFYHSQVCMFLSCPSWYVSLPHSLVLSFHHHMQLRIRVECAFGMFVQKWAMLRTAMPCNVSIRRVIALVNALAKLHNFCIDELQPQQQHEVDMALLATGGNGDHDLTEATTTAALDDFNLMANHGDGYIPLVQDPASAQPHAALPMDLLDGGHHFDGVPRDVRRQRSDVDGTGLLPRALLHEQVVQSHRVRPATNLHL
jgi:DDE superfamily endonuclease